MKRRPRLHYGFLVILLAGCGGENGQSSTEQAPQPTRALDETGETAPEPSTNKPSESETSAKKDPSSSVRRYSDEAFRIAAHDGNIDIVRTALQSGTDVDAADPVKKYTALLMAAYNGHTDVAKVLLKNGASVDSRDHEGKTPLMHACSGPFSKTVELLLDAGADINAKESTEGFTPLMTAAALGEQKVVETLLRNGADTSIRDEDQDSALDHARHSDHQSIVDLLQAGGDDSP